MPAPAPRWNLFAAVAVGTAVAMLALARASARMLTEPAGEPQASPDEQAPRREWSPSTAGLLVNVALSHGAIGGVLVAAAWYARIPAGALGLGRVGIGAIPLGAALGAGLYAANEVAATLTELSGIEHSERLRELLAPETASGWVVLLGGVLPAIAGVEELLFRGALIGALAAGYGLSPWLLAVASSVAFGLGHGLQGPGGVVVTGALGFALAAAYIATGSLLVVATAHYLINALEFLVHESPLGGG